MWEGFQLYSRWSSHAFTRTYYISRWCFHAFTQVYDLLTVYIDNCCNRNYTTSALFDSINIKLKVCSSSSSLTEVLPEFMDGFFPEQIFLFPTRRFFMNTQRLKFCIEKLESHQLLWAKLVSDMPWNKYIKNVWIFMLQRFYNFSIQEELKHSRLQND